MGTNPEHIPDALAAHSEPVTWIGRDRLGFDRLTPDSPVHPTSPPTAPIEAPQPELRRKWLLPAGAVLLALAISAVLWSTLHSKPKLVPLADQRNVPLISVMTPGLKAVTSSVTFTGAIAARYDMPIGNDGETGRIVAVYVEPGDHVQRGQPLAKLDQSVLIPQVNRLAAALEQAQAQAALSAAEYRRAQGVESAGALSAEDIEKRRATAMTDAANVKVAAALLAEGQARLNRTRIVAPIAGTVLTRRAEVGQIANPGGEALFRIASGGEIEMRGQLAEQDLAQVKVGDAASVHLTGLPQAFEGRVRLLGAIIDPQTRLGEIRITLKPDPALRPGAFARGTVAVNKALRPVVPQTAVLTDTGGSYVYLVNAQSHAERRAVRVADTSDQGVVISSGLSGSERVVTTAAGFLRDGEEVKAVAAPATQPSP
ncbi:MAG: efflux RND transporter periplasmic adaptor subunit [Gammaproteobacteria bacterium]|nr:MAG: efflux RND transporter periplasmic adaptor subunit [Gammaproteobacteria bacterium]TLY87541.1 MAG: efflux RND transporter periplasmic adaptor subunit [Gammaproteobacteria bacterium]